MWREWKKFRNPIVGIYFFLSGSEHFEVVGLKNGKILYRFPKRPVNSNMECTNTQLYVHSVAPQLKFPLFVYWKKKQTISGYLALFLLPSGPFVHVWKCLCFKSYLLWLCVNVARINMVFITIYKKKKQDSC